MLKLFCPKCGYENDSDAVYCEKCGNSLNSNSGSRTTIILIGVVVLLLAGLALTAGMVLNDTQKTVMNNSSAPHNNTTVEKQTPTTSTSKTTVKKANVTSSGAPYYVNDPTGDTRVCPNCGSNNWESTGAQTETESQLHCNYCGYTWWEPVPEDYQ